MQRSQLRTSLGSLLDGILLKSPIQQERRDLEKVSLLLNEFRDMDLSESSHQYSAQMKDLHQELDDPSSTPHVVLDSSLLSQIGITEENADIRITSMYAYAHTQFPNNRLLSDGILPFIRYREPNLSVDVNFSYATKLIPAKYYI